MSVDEEKTDPVEEPRDPKRESGGSEEFSLALGEAAAPEVRTELPDPDAIDALDRYGAGPILGEGGMGVVTLRRDRKIGRSVAQKTLHPYLAGDRTQRRFVREARAQAQLEHPAIVPVYDLGRDAKDGLFFTMKRVRGHTLARVLDGLGAKEPHYVASYGRRRLLTAFLQVCRAMDYAHARRVLHRDLKPSNVMLGDFGEVYVLDWGLARILDEAPLDAQPEEPPEQSAPSRPSILDAVDLSRTTALDTAAAGTLAYMAPEQLAGEALTPRTDLYALGIILYEILTHRRFREDPSLLKVAMEITEGRVARPSDVDPDADPELDAICARCTASDPSDRFESAGALADAIERVLDGERDTQARTAAAGRHLARAKEHLAGKPTDEAGASRVAAMHDLLRAVTLDPGAEEAQTLLVDLVSDVDGQVPPEARPFIARAREDHRIEGTTAAMLGVLAWLAPVPIVLLFNSVRSWPLLGLMVGACVGVLVFAWYARAHRTVGFGAAMLAAGLFSVVVVLTSGLVGPFVLVPTVGTTVAMFFAMYVSRRERLIVSGLLGLAVLVPFVLEAYGLVPPGYSIEGDRIVLFPRVIDLPPVATDLALAWSSGSFVVLAAWIVGRMHDRLERAEERLLVSAWHLRRLFAGAERERITPDAR